jgi:hypothetical protein
MSLLSHIAVDQSIPLPPPHLRHKVAGTEDGDWFTHSGRMSVADLSRALAAIDRSCEQFGEVLERTRKRTPIARYAVLRHKSLGHHKNASFCLFSASLNGLGLYRYRSTGLINWLPR